ncbi:transcription-repair coupling factor [Roseivirga thermotolerans]|uniref:Transcription-repair-coupling factor n=1 Tax=Roseivirga thermotolerans TaxID=1758176 RepID=A0ABQ3I1A4_9BACT|nr:transcription-repair coupling factor [Roseivirga thermotolerans]GHE55016.1 transcription-repair-coupling factor [Roseivirga thermotolerans]
MKVRDFIKIYREDSVVQTIAERIKPNETSHIRLKGLVGSLDAVIATAVYQLNKQTCIFVMHDKEEAAYFHNDLQNLLGEKEVLLFPTSYKRPYQFDETENANILMRAEILNRINHKASTGELIVTYPEALTEKVINKKSLSKNTFSAKVGEQLDVPFLTELLQTYDFEPTDFVYEAGQFSVRGGIVDVYSYANDLPYRIELFGNEIESIRTFDPVSQLSQESIKEINIIPNVQTRLLEETRQSFLSFIPKNSKIWFKDYQQTLDTIAKYFEKASGNFSEVIAASGTQVVLSPEELFEQTHTFEEELKGFQQIEFGNRFYLNTDFELRFEAEPQTSFNKNFDLIVENLGQWQVQNFSLCVAAESLAQFNRLETIFRELDPSLEVQPLNIGLRSGFIDKNREVLCYTDHQLFDRFHKYKTKTKHSKSKALTLKELRSLQPGDYVTHIDHGIARFAGMEKVDVNGKMQESIRLVYRDDDLLYVSVHSIHKISKYTGKEGAPPSISKLGSPEWENKKKRVKGKVKDIAKDLIELYAKRKKASGFAYSQDGFLQAELESSFIYEDTPDQAKATEDVKADMEQPHPMDRLVCGDVGFGKTEVAVRAAFKAAVNGKQVAVLVPTTILAMQHFRTFSERLADFPVKVEYINRFKTTKEIKETLQRVKEGKTEILIGTHRIVNKDVQFKDLGLLIIDEEQKFGVKVKDKLKELRVNVDVLTLTATPIPRTLHFSLMGARDLSVIATPPPNRQPVTTEIHTFNDELIRDAVSFELRRGGQVFFVHNRINDIEQVGNIILRLVPDARIGIAHGQMDGSLLEKRMVKFIEGEYDVLVSTNIIESGLDIPNANTIIINHAHMFGLSDLHQMRGRVGRSNRKAFCYLLTPPTIGLTSDARKRLSALEEFSDLGDGFKVAMRDLDIRGAGNLLGAEQSGFISDLGFDMYHKILDEAVQELKETEFRDLFMGDLVKEAAQIVAQDCTIETDLEILIPDTYVSNTTERIGLYAKLDNIKSEEKLERFIKNLKDRFGPIPDSVQDLIQTVRLRWVAEKLGFEKVIIKNESMKCHFMPSDKEAYFQSETFGKIIAFIQQHPKRCKMKEYKTRLILKIDEVLTVNEAKDWLTKMLE